LNGYAVRRGRRGKGGVQRSGIPAGEEVAPNFLRRCRIPPGCGFPLSRWSDGWGFPFSTGDGRKWGSGGEGISLKQVTTGLLLCLILTDASRRTSPVVPPIFGRSATFHIPAEEGPELADFMRCVRRETGLRGRAPDRKWAERKEEKRVRELSPRRERNRWLGP
jgi:hypothetical protein